MDPTPRNRERTRRPFLSILICGADECRIETDPNGLTMSVLVHDLIRTMPPRMDMQSTISGQAGAIMYASHDICLWGTPDEIDRLCRRDLEPHEAEALVNYLGFAFEWRDDFYDLYHGFEALQSITREQP